MLNDTDAVQFLFKHFTEYCTRETHILIQLMQLKTVEWTDTPRTFRSTRLDGHVCRLRLLCFAICSKHNETTPPAASCCPPLAPPQTSPQSFLGNLAGAQQPAISFQEDGLC